MSKFKSLTAKVLNRPIITFSIFIIFICAIAIFQMALGIGVPEWELFVSSLNKIIINFFKLLFATGVDQNIQIISRVVNIVCLIIICVSSYYFLRYVSTNLKYYTRHIRKYIHYIKYGIAVCYALYIIWLIFNPSYALSILHNFCIWVKEIVIHIFFYDSVGVKPTINFGVNLLIRFAYLFAIVIGLIRLPQFVQYFFIDKIQVQADSDEHQLTNPEITRFGKFIYDDEDNTIRIGNVILIISIIGAVILTFVGLNQPESAKDIIDYTLAMLNKMLQVSQIAETPFSEPIPFASFINTSFRIIIAFIFLALAFIGVSTLSVFRKILLGHKPETRSECHFKLFALLKMFLCVAILSGILYIISVKAGDIADGQISWTWIVIYAVIIFICEAGIVYFSYIVMSKSNDIITLYAANKREFYKTTAFYNACKYIIENIVSFFKKFVELFKKQLEPIYSAFAVNNAKSGLGRIMYAGANFCAISSIITTFLGLYGYYKIELSWKSPIISALSILVCATLTIGIQYVLLTMGIKIGSKIRDIITQHNKREEADTTDNHRIFKTVSMLIVYLFIMLISSLFSFSSLFSCASKLIGFQEIVNKNVWSESSKLTKGELDTLIQEYNDCNKTIAQSLDNRYDEFSRINDIMKTWDTNNVDNGNKTADDQYAAKVDNMVGRFSDLTGGTENYKSTIEYLLTADDYNEYAVEIGEQQKFFKGQYLYSFTNHKITQPYEYTIGKIQEQQDSNSDLVQTSSQNNSQTMNKYQLIDLLFHEYLNRLMKAESIYSEAKDFKYGTSASKDIANYATADNKINTQWLRKDYYNNIYKAKRIFESLYELNEEMKKKEVMADKYFTALSQIEEVVNEYTSYDDNAFDTVMERLIEILSNLPNIQEDDDKEQDIDTRDQSDIYDTITLVSNYYDYAISRKSSLSFGLDIATNGEILWILFNPHSDKLNAIYQQHIFILILLIIAFLIDLIPIVVGAVVGDSQE